jgi:hypothetical protein
MSALSIVTNIDKALKALGLVDGVVKMTEGSDPKTVTEQVEVEVKDLFERIKELYKEGNVRRLIIRDSKGKFVMEMPLTVGVVAGGVFAFTAPFVAAISAALGLLARVQIEVVRDVDAAPAAEGESADETEDTSE